MGEPVLFWLSLSCLLTARALERKMFSWCRLWTIPQEIWAFLELLWQRFAAWPWSSLSVLLPPTPCVKWKQWPGLSPTCCSTFLVTFSRKQLCTLFCFCQALSTPCSHISLLPSEKCLPFQQGQSSQFQRLPGKGSVFQRFASSKVIGKQSKCHHSRSSGRNCLSQQQKPLCDKSGDYGSLLACPWEDTRLGFSEPEAKENVISLLKFWEHCRVWSSVLQGVPGSSAEQFGIYCVGLHWAEQIPGGWRWPEGQVCPGCTRNQSSLWSQVLEGIQSINHSHPFFLYHVSWPTWSQLTMLGK